MGRVSAKEFNPRISIAMTTYNGEQFLAAQLESLATQTVLPLELVVGDDGSSDATMSILNGFAASAPFPVRVHRNSSNLGFADNFLATAERCTGDWIAFSDQDDVWLHNKLETVSREIASSKEVDLVLVAHQVEVCDSQLRSLGRRPNWHKWRGTQFCLRGSQYGLWSLGGCAMVCRSDLIKAVNWQDRTFNEAAWNNLGSPQSRVVAHDRWLSLLANSLGSTILLDEVLGLFRRHEAVITGTHASVSRFSLVRTAFEAGPEIYRVEQRAAEDAAATLRRHANRYNSSWGAYFGLAARQFDRLAEIKALRAQVQERRGRLRRIALVARVASRGGYLGGRFHAAGLRALAKDLVLAIRS